VRLTAPLLCGVPALSHSAAHPPQHRPTALDLALAAGQERSVRGRGDGMFVCQRYLHFIILESGREEDFPEKPVTASTAAIRTGPDKYNQMELKEN